LQNNDNKIDILAAVITAAYFFANKISKSNKMLDFMN